MTSLRKQKHPAFVLLGYFWHTEMSFLLESGEKKNWRAVRERSENSKMEGLQKVHSIISAC